MDRVVERVFFEHGLRFIFSTRSKVPFILKEGSKTERFYAGDYKFQPGVDEVVRGQDVLDQGGKIDGWVISYGEMVRYRLSQ